jgi:hypothetical protein
MYVLLNNAVKPANFQIHYALTQKRLSDFGQYRSILNINLFYYYI